MMPEKTWWLIRFGEPEMEPEVFDDEDAARARFEQLKLNWTCDLFVEVSLLDHFAAQNLEWAKAAERWKKELDGEQQSHDAEMRRLQDALSLEYGTTIEDMVKQIKTLWDEY